MTLGELMWVVARCGEINCVARWVLRGGCNCLTLWSVMYAFSVTGAPPCVRVCARAFTSIALAEGLTVWR